MPEVVFGVPPRRARDRLARTRAYSAAGMLSPVELSVGTLFVGE